MKFRLCEIRHILSRCLTKRWWAHLTPITIWPNYQLPLAAATIAPMVVSNTIRHSCCWIELSIREECARSKRSLVLLIAQICIFRYALSAISTGWESLAFVLDSPLKMFLILMLDGAFGVCVLAHGRGVTSSKWNPHCRLGAECAAPRRVAASLHCEQDSGLQKNLKSNC